MNDSQLNLSSIVQQLRPRLITALCLFIFALGTLFLIKIIEQKHAQHIINAQLPQLATQLHLAHEIKALTALVDSQLAIPIERISQGHQQLTTKIAESTLTLPAMNTLTNVPNHELERLANNSQRNTMLALNALNLIQNTRELAYQSMESVKAKIAAKEQGLANSFPIDEVTQVRQIMLGKLKLNNLLLVQIEYSLNLLHSQLHTLQKPAINPRIEETKLLVNQLIEQQRILSSTAPKQENQQALHTLLTQIYTLFFSDDALLGKWQGTTKRYLAYRDHLVQLKTQLQNINPKTLHRYLIDNSNHNSSLNINHNISQEITIFDVSLRRAHLNLGLVVLAALFSIMAITLMIGLFHRFNREIQQLVTLVEARALASNVEQHLSSQEQYQVISAINNALNNAITTADADLLVQSNSDKWHQVANMTGVCGWQMNQGNIVFTADALIIRLISNTTDNTTENSAPQHTFHHLYFWRKLLGNKVMSNVLNTAKKTKKTNEVHCIDVKINHKAIRISMCFKQGTWLGTIADNQHTKALEHHITQLTSQLNEQRHQTLVNTAHDHEILSQMIVQTMLQRQNTAITSSHHVQPIYRQLERIFDWLRQQQIVAKLASQGARAYTDVNIRQVIYALFNNMACETQLKHNQIHLAIDDKLVDSATVNVRLLTRLLSAFSRLLLKGQFNSELTISLDVIDQNAGQQIINVSGRVPDHKGNAIKHMLQLQEEATTSTHSHDKQYLFAILKALHGEHFTLSHVDDKAVDVSFTLPLTLTSKITATLPDTRLTQQHVLIISGNKNHRQLLTYYLQTAKAQCETLDNAALFAKNYHLAAINKNKLDAIVTTDMGDNLSIITQHINNLPKTKRPTLIVLQNSHSNLANYGLYSLADTPICQQQLIEEVTYSIAHQKVDNLLISAEHYHRLHIEPTQVELLLAVQNVDAYQRLWRTLIWLGFKITVVADSRSMIKHWQTGRYLILMNGFEASPFVQLLAGKSISRGVFNFSEDDVIELNEQQIAIGNHWHFGSVPTYDQLEALIQLLSPWLKISPKLPQSSSNLEKQATIKVETKTAHLNENPPPAFNLEAYASHQGSPELAAFMLDDYIDSLTDNSQGFEPLITENAHDAIRQKVDEINLIAHILAAPTLQQLGQQLEQTLLNHSYHDMPPILEQVKGEITVIKRFSEVI